MQVYQLQPGDDLEEASRLFDAYRQFYKLTSNQSAARTYLSMRLQSGQSAVFLAEAQGKAVGFMQHYPSFCSLAMAPIWLLYDLYVSPSARGAGVAGTLMDIARDHGKSTGAAYLQLSTAHANHTAQALYKKHGWQLDETFRYYTLSLETAI
ncbi:GNAT family N-acetyltransferase [Chitinimonas sp. BJB300]|uniref:GNAT family N-acetyltransferase n=1 Tax=Chitinimonas sp. BJB300 TaxID=1559339 RepID=UPI000C0D13D7|nr:GNAT family N-acetyltransferase [Chitinimonas sp. BJB300]PHV12491.1 GNAT family N-acetyltransferase [Chitinimonas sp. BJB300]TSJ89120.1 GNAT family N-acetyltransferase [Chitinimonas sp. BJB300]